MHIQICCQLYNRKDILRMCYQYMYVIIVYSISYVFQLSEYILKNTNVLKIS